MVLNVFFKDIPNSLNLTNSSGFLFLFQQIALRQKKLIGKEITLNSQQIFTKKTFKFSLTLLWSSIKLLLCQRIRSKFCPNHERYAECIHKCYSMSLDNGNRQSENIAESIKRKYVIFFDKLNKAIKRVRQNATKSNYHQSIVPIPWAS